ncbi:hypothetical protein [Mesorhizobium sp. CAU 1741]|uniref:hypothetical protein n=1 Tax=Mesorhizobium sp. CAU 1741 TaxID=3140366 RepID=UPI00325B3548
MDFRQDAENRQRASTTTQQPANPVSLVRIDEGGDSKAPKASQGVSDHYEIAIGRWKADVVAATATEDAGVRLRSRRKSEASEPWERRRMRRMRERIAARRRDRRD